MADVGKTQKIENQPFDEGIDVSGSDIASNDDEGADNYAGNASAQAENQRKPTVIEGSYNPSEYSKLPVSNEVRELFKHIGRYKPQTIEIQSKLRAFIPDFIPSIGEVDAFLKMPRPDDQFEVLGLNVLDEPALNQSDKAKIELIMANTGKQKREGRTQKVHSIEDASHNVKQISKWIDDVGDIHRIKESPSVTYSKAMPDIDVLMQEWPAEVEELLNVVRLPTENLDVTLEEYCRIALTMLDIPVHPANSEKNLIESLHVMFSLFSAFRDNESFKNYGQS